MLQHHTKPAKKFPDQKAFAISRVSTIYELISKTRQESKFGEGSQKSMVMFLRKPRRLLRGDDLVGDLYDAYKSDDDWLYVLYGEQDVFGGESFE